jgi:hypothetical protein
MSFLICSLFKEKAILACDRMALFPDGTFGPYPKLKFTKLGPDIVIGFSGNSAVAEAMIATLSGLLLGTWRLDSLEKRLGFFREAFSPVYGMIDSEILNTSGGSGQVMAIFDSSDDGLGLFSINYVPVENDFKTVVIRKPQTMIVSSCDENEWLRRNLQSLTTKILLSPGNFYSDSQMVKAVEQIYKNIARNDRSVSAEGILVIKRHGQAPVGVEFGG